SVQNAPRFSARWPVAGPNSRERARPSNPEAMERCARSKRNLRSSSENSSAKESFFLKFGNGDIMLPPPAQHKGAAATLLRAAVNLRPESHEVVYGGNQRQHYHEPDGQKCDPVNWENVAAHRPFRPAMIEDDSDDRDNLDDHLELAQFACFYREAFRRCNGTQTANQELAPNDHHGNPGGHQAGI